MPIDKKFISQGFSNKVVKYPTGKKHQTGKKLHTFKNRDILKDIVESDDEEHEVQVSKNKLQLLKLIIEKDNNFDKNSLEMIVHILCTNFCYRTKHRNTQ